MATYQKVGGTMAQTSSGAREMARGEEAEGSDEEDPNMTSKEVWKTLKKRACPIISGIVFEVFICYVYTMWSLHAEQDGRLAQHADLEDVGDNVSQLRVALWSVLGSCLVLRLLCLVCWARDCGPDSVWAALFMLFSSLPFICYWICYFAMQGQLQVRHVRHDVESHFGLAADGVTVVEVCDAPYDPMFCDVDIVVHQTHCCTHDFTSLVMAGNGVVPLFWMEETLSISTWYGMVLKWLSILAMGWIWKDMPLLSVSDTDTAFMNDVWVDILDAGVFADYIMNPWIQYYHFHLFYNLDDNVLHNSTDGTFHSASNDNGRTCESVMLEDSSIQCSGFLQHAIWWVWVVAFFSSILSPTLWTLFRFLDVDSKDDKDIESLLGDFTGHIRLLDKGLATDMVDQLVESQVKAYEEADGNREDKSHPVLVAPEVNRLEEGSLFNSLSADSHGLGDLLAEHADSRSEHREGTAVVDLKHPGHYTVTYSSGKKKTETVPISRLEPDTDSHQHMCGPNCCKGWLKASYLNAEDHPTQEFERRGKYAESFRSCFFLEIPFFIYRFHFVVLGGGSLMGTSTILLLKNAIFLLLDFLHVIACGNTKATCLNFTPIDKFEKFIKGSKLNSIFVGPGGMFKLAADLATKGIKEEVQEVQDRLNQHKAWLILEREKAQHDRDEDKNGRSDAFDEEIKIFNEAIEDVEKKLKKLDQKLKAVHM